MLTFSIVSDINDSWPEVLCQAWDTAKNVDPNATVNGLALVSFSIDEQERTITYEFKSAKVDDSDEGLDVEVSEETEEESFEQGDMD